MGNGTLTDRVDQGDLGVPLSPFLIVRSSSQV
jgi:hypothetical protein